jgi:hypothetical protein
MKPQATLVTPSVLLSGLWNPNICYKSDLNVTFVVGRLKHEFHIGNILKFPPTSKKTHRICVKKINYIMIFMEDM